MGQQLYLSFLSHDVPGGALWLSSPLGRQGPSGMGAGWASPRSWVKRVPVGTQVLRAAPALCLFLSQELASGDGGGIIHDSAPAVSPAGQRRMRARASSS